MRHTIHITGAKFERVNSFSLIIIIIIIIIIIVIIIVVVVIIIVIIVVIILDCLGASSEAQSTYKQLTITGNAEQGGWATRAPPPPQKKFNVKESVR